MNITPTSTSRKLITSSQPCGNNQGMMDASITYSANKQLAKINRIA
jgi:hypothetical protein